MSHYEQQVIDRDDTAHGDRDARGSHPLAARQTASAPRREPEERAARATLRAQIARLERERAAIVAERFPFIAAPAPTGAVGMGPRLLGLGELERVRDQLAAGVQELHVRVRERAEHERRAREQLQRMRLEPGRYKFARLPVRDLGLGVCGAWEVRPRLGLIGMLAGWWQLKLSSGCPLARGPRAARPRRFQSNWARGSTAAPIHRCDPRAARFAGCDPRAAPIHRCDPRAADPQAQSTRGPAHAGEAMLSGSHGVAVHARPRCTDVSIAANAAR